MARQKKLTLGLCAITFSALTVVHTNTYAENISEQTKVALNKPSSSTGLLGPTEVTTTTTTVTPAQPTLPSAQETTPSTLGITTSTPAPSVISTPVSTNAPLNQPNMTDEDITNWATNVARGVYSYDFKNHVLEIENNRQYFTDAGWKAFNNALNRSNNIKIVENKKLVASGTPTGKAVILSRNLRDGVYTWKIQVPLLATYESESRLIKQNLIINMLVTRALNKAKGVGVSHFVAVIVPGTEQPTTNITGSPADITTTTNSGTTTIYGAPSGTVNPPATGMGPSTITVPSPPANGSATPPGTVTSPNTLTPAIPNTPPVAPGMPTIPPQTTTPVTPNIDSTTSPRYPQ